MTPRLDDEMEAREWAKKRLYSEESHPEKWEMIDVEHAYLAGLLAERAWGLGTGEDEGVSANDIAQAMFDAKVELGQLVPASEVERLKDYYLREILKIDQVTYDRIAEAVKRERERCAELVRRNSGDRHWVEAQILTPSGEVKTI